MPRSPFFSALARSMLAGALALEPLVGRMRHTLGRNWPWLRPLARRFLAEFNSGVRPSQTAAAAFLMRDPGLRDARRKYKSEFRIAHWFTEPQSMQPVQAAVSWNIPRITTVDELTAWLNLTSGELAWFADRKHLASRRGESPLSHYRYRALTKNDGGLRLIEAPKRRLKELQRMVLREILANIPPHRAAHGFVPSRSIQTFAAPHVGRDVVLRMDLKDFFPGISAARVEAFFRTAGYPGTVAALLRGICTNAVPNSYWRHAGSAFSFERIRDAREIYSPPHLPQGAPSSPALTNICMHRVDCRLAGLAHAAGSQYTRYVDDLAFSGGKDFAQSVERFAVHAAAILLQEGFVVHHRKTRVMRQGVRQHLAGLVVNVHPNIARRDFDELKAILSNCVRHDPESQNRASHAHFRAHLEGRISFVAMINPAKGARLKKIFERIQW